VKAKLVEREKSIIASESGEQTLKKYKTTLVLGVLRVVVELKN